MAQTCRHARAQFAFTMSFHIVFPAFSIGLASCLAVLEAWWLLTGREVFLNLFNYWLKIFAIAFGMGVVSGIVMAYPRLPAKRSASRLRRNASTTKSTKTRVLAGNNVRVA
jgi:Cytochrome bd terminal oxidase subunit I